MKVCAHFNPSSHQFFHRRFQSMAEAKRYFRDLIRECDVHPWDEVSTRRYGTNRLVVDVTEMSPRFTSANRSRRIANQQARKAGLKLSSIVKLLDFETEKTVHVLGDYDITVPVKVRKTSYSFGSVVPTT